MACSWMVSLALVLLLRCSVISLAIPKTNFTDEAALLVLKSHITSDPSNTLANSWLASTSICDWFGVTCSSRHQRVVTLDLSNLQLQGTIPPHLGNLSFLGLLDLTNNSFHGSLPNELGRLRRLMTLDLSNNSFSGTIPSSLFNITTLESLWLPNNLFEGNILEHIGNVSRLQELTVDSNLFSGAIPAAIFNMSSLSFLSIYSNNLSGTLQQNLCNDDKSRIEFLDLGSNELYGQIPSDLYKCRELQTIGLDGNGFTGTIPRQFGNFTKLEQLYLSSNYLTGEIPKEIARLVSLQELEIQDNNIHGTILEAIGNLTSLRTVFMGSNNLTGGIPIGIGNCTLLEELWLEYNNLTGHFPSGIGLMLPNLQALHLTENEFSGPVPNSLCSASQLSDLSFAVNSFSGLIPECFGGPIPSTISNLSRIKYIDFTDNHLSGHLSSTIGLVLPTLEGLYMGGNRFGGLIPNSICNASQLIDLDLGYNSFSGFVPDCLGNLRNLQWLSMANNSLTSRYTSPSQSFLSSLTSCNQLVYLAFGGNPLGISLPAFWGNLSNCLQQFLFYECKMQGAIPTEIGNLSYSISLDLRENELTGTIPATLGKLKLLQNLGLEGNRLQGRIPYEVCYLTRLTGIYSGRNKLSGFLPACLNNLTSLKTISFSSNRISGRIPSTLWRLTTVLQVDLSFNSLSGPLALEIGNLKDVTYIELSSNQLSGDIPPTLASLKDVTDFYVSDNKFQGPIPQSLGEMVSLEFLDLSNNNLSGVIPNSLEKLLYLKYFNVSFNLLHGEIPDKGPFKNFTAESFMGNGELCGSPRMQVPPCKSNTSRPSKIHAMLVFRYILPAVASIVLVLAFVISFVRYRRQKKKVPAQNGLLPLATWRRISYHDLELATEGFHETNLLGSGSFGSVYRGILSDGMTVAVKVFNLQHEGAFVSFDRESEILRNLRHRNLVKIISSCSNPDFRALVFDFMPNWSLEKWLYSHNYFLDILQRLNVMIDVASALEYLHCGYATPVVHCDLKPSNVLLDEDTVAHVSDFGISKLLGEGESVTHTLTLATIGYMAPEFGLEGTVSVKGDAYSFGVLMIETFTRKKPTDEIFVGEMSLKNWVKQSLPNAITQVVDVNLLRCEEQHFAEKKECIKSILEVAMQCSADFPEDRPGMKDVVVALKKIKTKFLKDVERPRRRRV